MIFKGRKLKYYVLPLVYCLQSDWSQGNICWCRDHLKINFIFWTSLWSYQGHLTTYVNYQIPKNVIYITWSQRSLAEFTLKNKVCFFIKYTLCFLKCLFCIVEGKLNKQQRTLLEIFAYCGMKYSRYCIIRICWQDSGS